MTEIYLIRHGEAEGNVFRRIHGQYESLLTPRGYAQAACVARRFENVRIDACFSSDMTRTSLTARSIYIPKKLPLYRDPRFREIDLGAWEDLPFGYLDKFASEEMKNFNHNPPAWHATGAENFEGYTQRFIEGMVSAAEAFPGGSVAVFCHGAVMRGTLMRLFFMDDIEKLPFCDNTGVCKLWYDKGTFSYEFVNDNSHLPEELSTFHLQKWWRATGNRKDVNFYYVPVSEDLVLPELLQGVNMDSRGVALAAILHDKPVGVVSMGLQQADIGEILGMRLLPGLEGRYYGDQLLGCCFSHFRRLGCKSLRLAEGEYPDAIDVRYAFEPKTRSRSIDTTAFDWRCEK